MVTGLQAPPPRLSHDLGLQVVALLQFLEVATGVGFCHHCCNPRPCCKCIGASQLAPPMSWSQIVEQTPGYGVTTSSRGMTTPSTSAVGMLDTLHLCQASPLQISPFGACLFRRPLHPRDYLHLHYTDLPLGGPHR